MADQSQFETEPAGTQQEAVGGNIQPLREVSNELAPPKYDTPDQLDQESLGLLRQFFELLAAWDEKERGQ